MGKVYLYQEIAENSIPTKDDFYVAKDAALDMLGGLALAGEIYGGKVFGSVARGTPTPRSDFDLLIVTERESAVPALKRGFEEIYGETKVGIEPIVINRLFAQRGLHSIDRLFLEHIQGVSIEGNTAGSEPTKIIKPHGLSVTEVYKQYLAQKLRRLQEGVFAYTDTDRYRVLQRAFEAPVNVGRRTLKTLFFDLGLPDNLADDGKTKVIQEFRRVFGESPLILSFNSLLRRDDQYTFLLEEAVQGRISQIDYEKSVARWVEECIPQAVKWTSEISLFYANLLEGNDHSVEGDRAVYRGKEAFL